MLFLVRFFLLLSFPILLLADIPQENATAYYTQAAIPDWVKFCDFSLDPVDPKPSQVHSQCILLDTQTHLATHTLYWHRVVKVLSSHGVEHNGQISFDFNPGHQKVSVHMIRVYRDGEWSDRLESSRRKLLQREEGLDSGVYDGNLSLVYFLDDIRVGDVIESACSFEGENLFFSSHYCNTFPFQYTDSVEKISCRILAHPSQTLFIKPFHTSLEPCITDISSALREWIWENLSTAPDINDRDQPSWFDPSARVQISQYMSWQEVVEKILPLFTLPTDDQTGLEMLKFVKKWKESTQDPAEQASLAVRFVQDEVRYQGFEDGMGAFKPTDPHLVFERRFGDCKDKSFLLHALLKLMDISSEPLLVHSVQGTWLPEALPSPFAFNHVILKIFIDDLDYYVDPTMTLQGGSLADMHFPDFGWGLPISKQAGLIALPKLTQNKPTEIQTTIVLTSPELAEAKIQTVLYDLNADKMRRYIQGAGYQHLCDESIKVLKYKYGNATPISPLTISDDRLANVLVIEESYFLPTRDRLGRKVLKAHSFTVAESLDKDINLERNSPYALHYPVWVKEQISIKNPFNKWPQKREEWVGEHESIRYRYALQAEGENMDIHYELQHLKNHIPVEGLYDYWNILDEIDESNITSIDVTPKLGT